MDKATIRIALILLLLSPWVWTLVMRPNILASWPDSVSLIDPASHVFVTELNNLQSESKLAGVGVLGRVIVNKYTWTIKFVYTRYLESFDPTFLFFTGDIDPAKSTRENGPLPVSFIPLIFLGLSLLQKKLTNKYFVALLISPIPSVLIYQQYELISRIPLLLTLILVAALGARYLSEKRPKLLIFLFVTTGYELFRFGHYFFYHP